MAAARAHALTVEFTEPYQRHRPMVERSIAWLVRRGGRKVRYRGIAATRSGSPTAAPRSTSAGSSTSASTTTEPGNSPPESVGPGLTSRERHLRRSAIQRGRLSPSTSALRSVMSPDPPTTLRRPRRATKSALLSSLLTVLGPNQAAKWGSVNSSSWMLSGSRNTSTAALGMVNDSAIGKKSTPARASRSAHCSRSTREATANAR